jgi:hypothetical protein
MTARQHRRHARRAQLAGQRPRRIRTAAGRRWPWAAGLRVLSPGDFGPHLASARTRLLAPPGSVQRAAGALPALRRLVSHRIIQNAIALYWVQAATFIVPLLTVPYVTRVLGTSVFGLVAFSQSASYVIGILIDFGFEASMPRHAAAARNDRGQLSRLDDILLTPPNINYG